MYSITLGAVEQPTNEKTAKLMTDAVNLNLFMDCPYLDIGDLFGPPTILGNPLVFPMLDALLINPGVFPSNGRGDCEEFSIFGVLLYKEGDSKFML